MSDELCLFMLMAFPETTAGASHSNLSASLKTLHLTFFFVLTRALIWQHAALKVSTSRRRSKKMIIEDTTRSFLPKNFSPILLMSPAARKQPSCIYYYINLLFWCASTNDRIWFLAQNNVKPQLHFFPLYRNHSILEISRPVLLNVKTAAAAASAWKALTITAACVALESCYNKTKQHNNIV